MMDRTERFRFLRRSCGLSINGFARRYGLSPMTARNWANGTPDAPPWVIRALEDLLNLQQRGRTL